MRLEILYLILIPIALCFNFDDESNKKFNITVDEISPYDNPSETYRYYSLDFCTPNILYEEKQTLGESLSGNRKMNTLYELEFENNVHNVSICTKEFSSESLQKFKDVIFDSYIAEFNIESFPIYDFIGVYDKEKDQYFLKTHINFQIYYDEQTKELLDANVTTPLPEDLINISENNDNKIINFSYSMNFIPIKDSSLFEKREENINEEIHWFAIINSFVLVLLLITFVLFILARVIKNEVNMANDLERENSIPWKSIRSELFLAPPYRNLLSSFVGSGVQFLILSFLLITLGVLGFHYENKGSMKSIAILLYSVSGFYNGFYTAKYYKYMGGKHWALNLVTSSILFPIVLFVIWSFLNSLAWSYGSTAALPFTTVFFIVFLWIFVYLPLNLFGGLTGRIRFKEVLPYSEEKFMKIPKEIPRTKWYKSIYIHFLLSGFLPFSSIYLELTFIFNSVWGHKLYHFFGTLFFAVLLSLIVVACITVVFSYFTLSNQDYKWWWKSFFFGGSSAFFIFIYSIYFYKTQSHMFGLLQFSFFFGYSSIACFIIFLMFGSVGFLSAKYFVSYVFDQSKLD